MRIGFGDVSIKRRFFCAGRRDEKKSRRDSKNGAKSESVHISLAE
jgi:hypothetical protein